MNFYLTSGTSDYMEKLVAKQKKEPLVLLHGQGNSVVLHESEKKSVFAVPRKFEVVSGAGDIEQRGYFVFYNMPIVTDDRPVFEKKIKDLLETFERDVTFISYRFLRPVKEETYILLTHWVGPASYEVWKNSNAYKNTWAAIVSGTQSSMQTMFNASTYVTTYSAPPEE